MSKYELNYLHLCDSAFLSQDGKLNLIGIFDVVNLVTIPSAIMKASLAGSITIDKPIPDMQGQVLLFGPEGESKELAKFGFEDARTTPRTKGKLGFIIDFLGLEFTTIGKHTLKVVIDQQEIGAVGLNVMQVEGEKL